MSPLSLLVVIKGAYISIGTPINQICQNTSNCRYHAIAEKFKTSLVLRDISINELQKEGVHVERNFTYCKAKHLLQA